MSTIAAPVATIASTMLLRTSFNGFGAVTTEIVDDEPMVSLYGAPSEPLRSKVVKL